MTDTNWPTGLMVIQGNHLEELRNIMTHWIKGYPLGPLEDEQILVQSNGIAQWLKMALAEDDRNGGCGIAAAMNVQLPGRFLWQGYRNFEPNIPKIGPFDKDPLTWTLYSLLSEVDALKQAVADPEVLKPLLGFLQPSDAGQTPVTACDPRRIYQLAAKLADLYDQYQVYRPDWLTEWEQGRDSLIRLNHPEPESINPEQRWQPELWRLVTRTIQNRGRLKEGNTALDTEQTADESNLWALKSRSAIHNDIVERCKQLSEAPDDLPRRVIVFGISALPYTVLEFLESIAKFTQVMLFVHNPCQHYWGDLIEGRALLKQYNRTQTRKLDQNLSPEALHLQGNPLLASWGKQGRDYLHLLDERDQPERYQRLFDSGIDLFISPKTLAHAQSRVPLLIQLQEDIFELRSPDDRKQLHQYAEYQIDLQQDQSLQFLIAHSAQREVEILHDQLLNEFEQAKRQGRTLNPRDILVMVPDINAYAPHIQAVFGRYKQSGLEGWPDARDIPFHISDQSQRGRNSLLTAFEALLNSRDARFSVTELLDLLDTPALLARFGLAPEQLPKLHQWIHGANVRWGLDAQHRSEIGLPEAGEQNSWLFGLKRMLLGYATGSSGPWTTDQGLIEPYDEVAGLEAALLGPLVLLIGAIAEARQQLHQARTAREWEVFLNQLCGRFFLSQSKSDRWALDNIAETLEQWQEICEYAHCADLILPTEVARDELLARIDQPTLTQKFLGGAVNFATLMPMRAIPFAQIWMLGMNDNDYPRRQKTSDFDLMAKDYRPGDRSRREDDRYLFLEALLSARDKLVISWVGRSIRDNSPKPPSVLVGQLRDHIQAGWSADVLNQMTTEHPLQPFSQRYFSAQAESQGLYTYAHEWRQVHNGYQHREQVMPPLVLDANITPKDLADFLRYPLKSFYLRRLGVSFYDPKETAENDELFAPDGLGKWALHDQLFKQISLSLAHQQGGSVEQHLNQAFAKLKGAGSLPMGHFADLMQEQLKAELLASAEHYVSLLHRYPLRVSGGVHLLPITFDGVSIVLEGQVLDCRRCHSEDEDAVRILLQPSSLYHTESKQRQIKYYHLLKFWPEHLFAQLDQPTHTYLLGSQSESPVVFKSMTADDAKALLLNIGQIWLQGMQQPQPLACKTAIKWLFAQDKAAETYEGGYQKPAEREDHSGYSRLWPDFESLTHDGRFAKLAERLYQPMLAHLQADATTDATEGENNL